MFFHFYRGMIFTISACGKRYPVSGSHGSMAGKVTPLVTSDCKGALVKMMGVERYFFEYL